MSEPQTCYNWIFLFFNLRVCTRAHVCRLFDCLHVVVGWGIVQLGLF